MSKVRCPCCARKAKGKTARRRVEKWLADARLDRFMFEKLGQFVKAALPAEAESHPPGDSPAAWSMLLGAEKAVQPVQMTKEARRASARDYYRKYYHANKERIERMRRERAARRVAAEKRGNGVH